MDANELATQICGCATPQQRKADIAALLAFREAAVSEALTTAQAQTAAQEQRIAELERALRPFAFLDMGKDEDEGVPFTTQEVWETIYRDRVQDWFSFEELDAARAALGEQQ